MFNLAINVKFFFFFSFYKIDKYHLKLTHNCKILDLNQR